MKFLFIEPFFGGSHKDFAEGLISHSRHKIELITLPARFWKWRMRGAALHFYKMLPPLSEYKGIITSSLMSLADFKMLTGSVCPPVLVYFHENQLTYPLAPGETMDLHFGFTDITTGLAADRILFNSGTQMRAFFETLPGFLRKMPEYRPHWVIDELRIKADFFYPGCHFSMTPPPSDIRNNDLPPLIIWNHRWEFDKNPDDFVDALDSVAQKGIEFRLALLGENFQTIPEPLKKVKTRFKRQLVQYGYVSAREDYHNCLRQGSIAVSTALQENFGISTVEAMRFGCLPLLPRRLSYPEILPKELHDAFLYKDQEDLIEKLAFLLTHFARFESERLALIRYMERFAWENRIHDFDDELCRFVSRA